MKPTFIVIGAARSGTTSLHKYLEAHPEISMSEIKEINYFSNQRFWKNGHEWYFNHFKKSNTKVIGEASTSYSAAPLINHVPQRIYDCLGDIKLIYLLRDPIERLLSHYMHYVQRGERETTIDELINNGKEHDILTQGKYSYQIEEYLKYFPRSSIHLITIDDLKNRAEPTVSSIYKFLGVDDTFLNTDINTHHNKNSKVTKKTALGKVILNMYHKHIEQRPFPYTFKKQFLNAAEIGAIEIFKPQLSNHTLKALTKYYSEDVAQLKENYNIDISNWRNYSF